MSINIYLKLIESAVYCKRILIHKCRQKLLASRRVVNKLVEFISNKENQLLRSSLTLRIEYTSKFSIPKFSSRQTTVCDRKRNIHKKNRTGKLVKLSFLFACEQE